MKIRRIRCRIVSHPLPAPLRPSWAPGRTFEQNVCTLVEVITDQDLVGLGALPHGDPIGLHTVAHLVAPYLLGKDPFAVERLSPILRHAARDGSYPWGVEMALWDIIGQACNQPVYRLWGGYQDSLPAYASLAEICEPGEQIERLHRLRQRGFRAFKLRLRRPRIEDDIEVVQRVRAEFGNDITLMADANQSHVMPSPGPHNFWSFPDALRVARALEELDLLWLEEPLPRYNYDQLSSLAAQVDISIAGGELNIGLHEYRQLMEHNCYDIIQADAAFSEGISQLRKVAAMAEMAFKPFIPHTWSNGIGLGANLHLAGATPNCPWFEFPVDPPAWTEPSRDFMLAEPYQIQPGGSISIPDRPGLGFQLDQDRIRAATIEAWESD